MTQPGWDTPHDLLTVVRTREDIERDILALEVLSPRERLDAAKAAEELEAEAIYLGEVELMLRARLVGAVALCRLGRLASSTRIIRDVHRWATENEHRYLLARSERHLSHVCRLSGDCATALEHAIRSMENTTDTMPVEVRTDHQHVLAIAMARTGDYEGAIGRFEQMRKDLRGLGRTSLEVSVLNNLAYAHLENGHLQAAADTGARMMRLAKQAGISILPAYLDTYARILLRRNEPHLAVDLLAKFDGKHDQHFDIDSMADCMLTLAEAHHQAGDIAAAHQALDRCETICRRQNLMEILMRVRQARSELFADEHRWKEAYLEHRRYTEVMATVSSTDRARHARVVAAVYQTEQALMESQKFRWLSQQDALTGLPNRRFVNENLPELLRDTREAGGTCSVALLDLDHFKRINDEHSHEVGDQVLVRVAKILAETLDGQGTAARLGGEEFLLLLPSMNRQDAISLGHEILRKLRDYPWRSVADGLQSLTASVGMVTCTLTGAWEQEEVLRTADMNLYRAKSNGRDRLVASVSTGSLKLVGEVTLPTQSSVHNSALVR
ncbi:MAG: hypothetical protein CSA58_03105 [Micrococcales bacterium]|nr:MAG: hypothetical protein CSB46_00350 [Micrococcales bacterium]PIE27654.1 MAG: hypothetical protein CSA58_03105 [Micrococcales bacterium]